MTEATVGNGQLGRANDWEDKLEQGKGVPVRRRVQVTVPSKREWKSSKHIHCLCKTTFPTWLSNECQVFKCIEFLFYWNSRVIEKWNSMSAKSQVKEQLTLDVLWPDFLSWLCRNTRDFHFSCVKKVTLTGQLLFLINIFFQSKEKTWKPQKTVGNWTKTTENCTVQSWSLTTFGLFPYSYAYFHSHVKL